jgi:hypothetical protein
MRHFAYACVLGLSVLVAGCSSSDAISSTNGDSAATGQADHDRRNGGGSLYARLHGNDGIAQFVALLANDALADPEIAPFFAAAGTPGHPNQQQILECLTALLAKKVGGPDRYPLTVSGGFRCRESMHNVHRDLHIPRTTASKFASLAAGAALAAGINDDDGDNLQHILQTFTGSISQ